MCLNKVYHNLHEYELGAPVFLIHLYFTTWTQGLLSTKAF